MPSIPDGLASKKVSDLTVEEITRLQQALTGIDDSTMFPIAVKNSTPTGSIQWPNDGSFGMMPAGTNTFDLTEGKVTFADGETSEKIGRLENYGVDYVQSMHFHPFFDSMSVTWIGPSGKFDGPQGVWMDNQHHVLTNERIKQVEVTVDLPSPAFAEFGFAPEAPPLTPDGMQNPHQRVGSMDPVPDAWTGVVMQPAVHNPRTDKGSIMSKSRATSGNPAFGAKVVGGVYTNSHNVLVTNTGSNTIGLRVREAGRAPIPGVLTADDVMTVVPSTNSSGTTAKTHTLASGNSTSLQVDRGALFFQLQVQNNTAGQSNSMRMAYWALAGT